jgi:fatty-acyl-CoA synthase
VDAEGHIQVVDRLKDIIISGGLNIASVEVEACLLIHSAVYEVAVVAVPDARWGETPKAIVVLKPGAQATEAELIQHCRDRLAHFKAPRSVDFRDALPKSGTGKILKRELREPFWRGHSQRVH